MAEKPRGQPRGQGARSYCAVLMGCQAGVIFPHMRNFARVGSRIKRALLSFRCHFRLTLCSVVFEAPVLPRSCCVRLRSFSPRFSTACRFSSSGSSPKPPLKPVDGQKTPDLIQVAALFIMAASAFLSYKSIDPVKDFVIDLDVSINETVLNFGPLHHTKQLLADNSQAVSPRLCSNLA